MDGATAASPAPVCREVVTIWRTPGVRQAVVAELGEHRIGGLAGLLTEDAVRLAACWSLE
jgi:hypothetical protein